MSRLMPLFLVIGTILLIGIPAIMRARRNDPTPMGPIPDDVMREMRRRAIIWGLVSLGAIALLVIAQRAKG